VTPPVTTTLAGENLTPTNATLTGIVNPESATTEYYFQWGLTTNYGHFTPTNTLSANLDSVQAVTAYIGNLTPNTTIHFRVAAVNSAGTSYGGDQTAAIPALPVPEITQVNNQVLIVGQQIVLTNVALVATPPVTFSLSGAVPEGASMTTNGIFSWDPTCAEGSTTNVITVVAIDSGTPPLSNTMTFVITVNECVQLGIGSAVVQAGQSSNVPVTLFTTVGITNLSFSLALPANRFSNWTINPSNSSILSATVKETGSLPPVFDLVTHPGQTLQSPSVLGTIGFTALPADSGFLPVVATNIIGLKAGGGSVGNATSLPGQVTVIGVHPLLGASLGSGSTRILTLFGNPGSNYDLAFSTNLESTNWQVIGSVQATNLQQNINLNQPGTQVYIRVQ
jgi:hypothetical protein